MAVRARAEKNPAKTIRYSAIAAVAVLFAPAAFAQNVPEATAPVAEMPVESNVVVTETAWFEAFTTSMNDSTDDLFAEESLVDWNSPSGRWTVTFGLEEVTTVQEFQLEGMSAGAYVDFGDIRFGTEIRIPSTDFDFLRPVDEENPQPEIKFESALRF